MANLCRSPDLNQITSASGNPPMSHRQGVSVLHGSSSVCPVPDGLSDSCHSGSYRVWPIPAGRLPGADTRLLTIRLTGRRRPFSTQGWVVVRRGTEPAEIGASQPKYPIGDSQANFRQARCPRFYGSRRAGAPAVPCAALMVSPVAAVGDRSSRLSPSRPDRRSSPAKPV